MKKLARLIPAFLIGIIIIGCSSTTQTSEPSFEEQVADYIVKYSYQETHRLAMSYTEGDPAKLNTWIAGATPALVKAGEDLVVRMNNDTYYKLAFLDFSKGPVTLSSNNPSKERFSSFQLMDDRNTNFRNVIHPDGSYTLYYGQKPEEFEGEAIEAPSQFAVVIVRVEVKDQDNADDVADAQAVFEGIFIDGPRLDEMSKLDLLSGFDEEVETEAHRRIDSTATNSAFRELAAGTDQVPEQVSYLSLAAGSKVGWGAPVPSHSSYEALFLDKNGENMMGERGTYNITTEEPQVDAFWSVTVYDTERGGYLHPNDEDKYHINNTNAVKNEEGTVTFTFKQECEGADLNCLEVPAGQFDLTLRYYLPSDEIISGKWTIPRAELMSE